MHLKNRFLLIALCGILATLLTQPSLAYYTTVGRASNVVTSGNLKLKIHEKTSDNSDFPAEGVYVIPGDIVSKRVYIENICSHPFYLRVKLISYSDNADLSAADCLKLDIDTENWVWVDGYYYYSQILQPGESSAPVFSQVEIVGSKVDQSFLGTTLNLTVRASAVQSENNRVNHPWEAQGWPAE